MYKLKVLSNQNLLKGLNQAVQNEVNSQVTLVEYLAEMERRKLFAELGYSSLWRFAVEELHLSEDSAIKRIQAARLGLKYTCIFPLLKERKLSLSVLYLLYPHMKDKNFCWLVDNCQGKSVREVKTFLAKHFPKKPTPDAVTELSSDQVRISFTANKAFRVKLEKLKVRTRHLNPKGALSEFFSEAMDAFEKELEKKNRALRSTKKQSTKHSRYLSKQTRQRVWERDQGSCSFVSVQGKRCAEKGFLEFDHKVAWAHGGSNLPDNIQLLCRTHNRLRAEKAFGRAFIEKKIEERQALALPESFPVAPKRSQLQRPANSCQDFPIGSEAKKAISSPMRESGLNDGRQAVTK